MLGYLSADIICSEKRNCELRGTDNVQGHIRAYIFKAKLRLLCLLSFKYFSQQAGSVCQSVICQHVKVCQLASKTASFNIHFQNFEQTSLQLKEYAWEKVQHFSERKTYFFNCVDTSDGSWRIRFTVSIFLSRTRSKRINASLFENV